MKRNAGMFCFLVLTLAALGGCSSKPSATDAKKAKTAPDTIQGKAQVLVDYSSGASDAALNAGRSNSVYLWEGAHRYRLFLKTAVPIVHGSEYIAEGVYAQKAIEEIGDPDQGKNGYPLQSSCERVIKMAWSGLPFDEFDAKAQVLRATVKRYPARAVFLVTRIRPVTATEGGAASAGSKKGAVLEDKSIREISVAAEKQRALLVEGSAVQTAPLWEPEGGTVRCKVVIDPEGKITELETGAQLCETVAWDKFRYQPPVQAGHPVKVRTEVEVRFEARK
ncbi:MAG: energy transducer TonB [Acidobacteriia bacterium]|nr:energy transducer TonB [Terriglobia bacterium]